MRRQRLQGETGAAGEDLFLLHLFLVGHFQLDAGAAAAKAPDAARGAEDRFAAAAAVAAQPYDPADHGSAFHAECAHRGIFGASPNLAFHFGVARLVELVGAVDGFRFSALRRRQLHLPVDLLYIS